MKLCDSSKNTFYVRSGLDYNIINVHGIFSRTTIMAPPKGVLLAHTDFPLYVIQSLDDKHFIVGGGGGQAKTGIPNAIVSRLRALNDNSLCEWVRHLSKFRSRFRQDAKS